MTTADNDDGDYGRQQRRTTSAADDDCTRLGGRLQGGRRSAGGAVKTNGIRQKADKPAGPRAQKNKEIEFTQKAFF
jgi:hypothetical protein